MFNTLLSFIEFLVSKFVSLNDESYIVRPTLINLNIFDLKYYSFMVSLDKCNGSCNVLSPKICVPIETKDINVKVFNMIPIKNKAKAMTKHTSCDCKYKFNITTCNSNQKWNKKTCYCKCKSYLLDPSTCICENSKYLKSIADTLVLMKLYLLWILWIKK